MAFFFCHCRVSFLENRTTKRRRIRQKLFSLYSTNLRSESFDFESNKKNYFSPRLNILLLNGINLFLYKFLFVFFFPLEIIVIQAIDIEFVLVLRLNFLTSMVTRFDFSRGECLSYGKRLVLFELFYFDML